MAQLESGTSLTKTNRDQTEHAALLQLKMGVGGHNLPHTPQAKTGARGASTTPETNM